MAQTLQITDGTTTVNLITGAMELRSGGWSTHTALDGDGIWEVFEIVSRDTDANLRTAKVNFDTLIEKARVYIDKNYESVPVFLKWQSEGETTKQALVLDGESELNSQGPYSPMLGETTPAAFLRLSVLRHPLWEAASSDDASSGLSSVSTLGGSAALAPSGSSSAPGRVSVLQAVTSEVTTQSKIWCGVRPTRLGTAGFISVWEAENGTNFTDAADAADASASDGNRVTISFATGTALTKRFTLRWGQVAGGNYDDIIGRYLVLGRVKLSSAATEVVVQLRHGWGGSSNTEAIVGTTYLSGVDNSDLTNWNLVELGFVDIPPTGNRDGYFSSDIQDYFLIIYAEQLAGASLYFDCFVLIPAEHMVTANDALLASGTSRAAFITGPDDFQTAFTENSGLIGNMDFSFTNWQYPVGGGVLVWASQPSSQHILSETVGLTYTVYHRYKSFHT